MAAPGPTSIPGIDTRPSQNANTTAATTTATVHRDPGMAWLASPRFLPVIMAATRFSRWSTLLSRTPATHWLIFDADGAKRLTIRGAAWLSASTIRKEIIENPVLVKRGASIAELAAAAGLPTDALADTVTRYNRFIERGTDTDFGRIGPGTGPAPPPIR